MEIHFAKGVEMKTELDILASIDSIKAQLGKGEVVSRERQSGKTIALAEFVHEQCGGFCIVITCNPNEREYFAHYYKARFGSDKKPHVLTLDSLRHACLDGGPRHWVTDEIWPSAAIRNSMSLEYLEFLGGVGTPMCMDMHSR
jgi:hypothetical protein